MQPLKWLAAALAAHAASHLPVRLPQYLPYAQHAHVYSIVEEARPDYYSIDFAAVPDCNGAHVCSWAHAIGSRKPLVLGFRPPQTGAYCDDATLTWKDGAYYYELTFKCGTRAQLEAMRRSVRRY